MHYNEQVVKAYYGQELRKEPVFEHRFHGKRKWRFDIAFPEEKIAIEVEGGVFTGGRHTRGKGFLKDMEKYNTATTMGWRVLRVIPQEVCMMETIEMIRKVMEL